MPNKYNININNKEKDMGKKIHDLESELKYYTDRCYDLERVLEQMHCELSDQKNVIFSIDKKDDIEICLT